MQLEALSLIDMRVAALGHVPAGSACAAQAWRRLVVRTGCVAREGAAASAHDRVHAVRVGFGKRLGALGLRACTCETCSMRSPRRTPYLIDKFSRHAMAARLTLRESSLPCWRRDSRAKSNAGSMPTRWAGHCTPTASCWRADRQHRHRRGAARWSALGLRLPGADVGRGLRRRRHEGRRHSPSRTEVTERHRRSRRCDQGLPLFETGPMHGGPGE